MSTNYKKASFYPKKAIRSRTEDALVRKRRAFCQIDTFLPVPKL